MAEVVADVPGIASFVETFVLDAPTLMAENSDGLGRDFGGRQGGDPDSFGDPLGAHALAVEALASKGGFHAAHDADLLGEGIPGGQRIVIPESGSFWGARGVSSCRPNSSRVEGGAVRRCELREYRISNHELRMSKCGSLRISRPYAPFFRRFRFRLPNSPLFMPSARAGGGRVRKRWGGPRVPSATRRRRRSRHGEARRDSGTAR